VGGGSACTHAGVEYAEAPPTPDPSPPSAFAQGLRRTEGGEKSVLAAGANLLLPDMRQRCPAGEGKRTDLPDGVFFDSTV
jgi:hypothetical protein